MTFQYQVLANQLAHRIYQDELKPHQKLISLRDFARQHGISLSTAKSCYELLEARGLIYVKPKSGYFVVARAQSSPIPESPDFLSLPRQVSNLELHNQIQEAALQSHLVPLGSIQLTPHFIPVEGLRRSIQRALKIVSLKTFFIVINKGMSN